MITKDKFTDKLKLFLAEIENCNNKNELVQIADRLQRYMKNVYPDDDPFVKKCKPSWNMPPSTMSSLESSLGYSGYYVSPQEDRKFWEKQVSKNKKKISEIIMTSIEYIDKDDLPVNNKTILIDRSIKVGGNFSGNANSGDSFSGTQTNTNISNVFLEKYHDAIREVEKVDNSVLSDDDKDIIFEALAYIKECIEEGKEPKKTFLRQLESVCNSEVALSVGANLVTIMTFVSELITKI